MSYADFAVYVLLECLSPEMPSPLLDTFPHLARLMEAVQGLYREVILRKRGQSIITFCSMRVVYWLYIVHAYCRATGKCLVINIPLQDHAMDQRLNIDTLSIRTLDIVCGHVVSSLVYRARPSLPRVMLLSHALNYKRVWRGGREGLAEVISIHSLFS